MTEYENSPLWHSSLGLTADSEFTPKQLLRLRNAYLQLRDRVAVIASAIPENLRDFTVHDISHLDSLWMVASTLSGQNYSLNPLEGFVLGCAFLIHDLGMSLLAYPGGISELRSHSTWRDRAALELKWRFGRQPSESEIQHIAGEPLAAVIAGTLRDIHAETAGTLLSRAWKHPIDEMSEYLLEDSELRASFAELAGRIAHSHWWSIDRVIREFKHPVAAPPNFPPVCISQLKLACMLRAADACQISGIRAPRFLFTIRSPEGHSKEHWRFQSILNGPTAQGDLALYSSSRALRYEEAASWWLCFDALQVADNELRAVDAALRNSKESDRLVVRGVAGAGYPDRVAEFVKTAGWKPVDTRLKIANVNGLISRLGGKELYGNDSSVPLRELLQNSIDAIVARRLIESASPATGLIKVALRQEADQFWLSVLDDGVGMSESALCGPLIDFGESYWTSPLVREEHPGLLARGFEPSGKYGIGFFSVFMLGDSVRVITRTNETGKQDTLVLEWSAGLSARPLLRSARDSECLVRPGTRVEVRLKDNPFQEGGLLAPYNKALVKSFVSSLPRNTYLILLR